MKSSLILIVITSVIIYVVGEVSDFTHKYVWHVQSFFAILQIISNSIKRFIQQKPEEDFTMLFQGLLVLRFLFTLFFVGIITWLKPENPILFVINFFSLYLCYSVFEFRTLISNLRAKSKRESE